MNQALFTPASQSKSVFNATQLRALLHQPRRHANHRLGEVLVAEGVINQDQLEVALTLQRLEPQKKLGPILIELYHLTPEIIHNTLSEILALPIVDLTDFDFESDALFTLSVELAREHHAIPLIFDGEMLVIATNHPFDQNILNALRFYTGHSLEVVLASQHQITQAINQHYGNTDNEFSTLINKDLYLEENQALWKEAELLAQRTPIVKLVGNIIQDGILSRASDIHIRPAEKFIELLYRIDGEMIKFREIQKGLLPAIISRLKILSRLNIAEHRLPQDGRFHLQENGKKIDLRLSIIPVQYGESVVIRILNKEDGLRSIGQIGFNERDEKGFLSLISRSYGLILVTGPTGSGKSTTLYAALQEINKRNVNTITVEDPIEYELEGMRQIQLIQAIDFSFPQALKHILRHDPDVIMIGEMRDYETCKIAVESALTGHLVLSTLHTNDAAGAISRLMEMGIEPYLIKSALIGVLAQRLVRRNCPHCLIVETVDPAVREHLALTAEEVFYKGCGCPQCNMTGYKGRLAVTEFMPMTDNLRRHLELPFSPQQLSAAARKESMLTLLQSGLEQARLKHTSIAEVYRACS